MVQISPFCCPSNFLKLKTKKLLINGRATSTENFTIDEISIDCWIIKIDNEFWFKAHDIAVFFRISKS